MRMEYYFVPAYEEYIKERNMEYKKNNEKSLRKNERSCYEETKELLKDVLSNDEMETIEYDDLDIFDDAFSEVDFDRCVLHVPSGTRWAYRNHTLFSKFTNIEIE